MTASAPVQLGEPVKLLLVMDVLPEKFSYVKYPVFGYLPIAVVTPFTTTTLQDDKDETGEELSQILPPRFVHEDTVVNPVITGLGPDPYASIVTGLPAEPPLLIMRLP